MLAEVFLLQGDLEVARQRVGEAAILSTELKDRLGEAEAKLLLSRIALAEGKTAEAVIAAQAADQVFRAEGANDRAAMAKAALAEAHLAEGKKTDAVDDAVAAVKLAGEREAAAARDALGPRIDAAQKGGMVTLWLEGRLARAEATVAAGDAARGIREAGEVATAANEKGLGLLVKRARVLAGS
jgi:hypothetical protein